ALTLAGGASVVTGTGTLTINGNINVTGGFATTATISGNLNLGTGAPRTIDVADQASLPYELVITANINGGAGIHLLKTNSGGLLLSGNNPYPGDTFLQAGTLAVGSDTALGTGLLSVNGTLVAESGAHTLANAVSLDGTVTFGGGSDLTFTNV